MALPTYVDAHSGYKANERAAALSWMMNCRRLPPSRNQRRHRVDYYGSLETGRPIAIYIGCGSFRTK